MGQLLNERACSFRSTLFPFREYPIWEELCHAEKQTGIHKKLSPFVKLVAKQGGVPIHLKEMHDKVRKANYHQPSVLIQTEVHNIRNNMYTEESFKTKSTIILQDGTIAIDIMELKESQTFYPSFFFFFFQISPQKIFSKGILNVFYISIINYLSN